MQNISYDIFLYFILVIKSKSISLKGNPYRFKCQNGDFAVVQTEWSNFVNPWSDRVEFVIGKHKIIQVIFKKNYYILNYNNEWIMV